jgi:hypothetical protein
MAIGAVSLHRSKSMLCKDNYKRGAFLTTDGSRLHAAGLHATDSPQLRKDNYRPGMFLTGDGGAAYAAEARPGAIAKSAKLPSSAAFPGSDTLALAEKALGLIARLAHTLPNAERSRG